MIHEEQKAGILTVTGANRSCQIYFKGGKIIFVRGNRDKELRLGALLMANNLLDEEKLEDMLAVAKAMEKRLGAVLVERKYISPEDLANILNLQFKEVVTETLSWDDAKFTYKDGLDGYVEDVHCEVDPVRLAAESKKRGEFKGIIPNDQVVFLINPGAEKSKSVHAARDMRVRLLLDGRRSVAQIIKETGYSRLAVYRSLAILHAENAIVRKDAARQVPKVDWAGPQIIVALYSSLLQLMLADLAAELGQKKASGSFGKSMTQSTYYEPFLKVFQLNQDSAANIGQIQTYLNQQRKSLTQKDFIIGFNEVVAGLLREQYEFLGYKATNNTVKRMRAALETVPANQKLLARAISQSLENYEDEDILSGKKMVASTVALSDSGSIGDGAALPNLDKMEAGTIVHFYNDMFQVVMADLEREVGAKGLNLLQKIIKGIRDSENLLTQFDLQGNSSNIAQRMQKHMSAKAPKRSKNDLVMTFQEVLRGLLFEESRLLGPKATEATVARLAEKMTAANPQFKPLVDQLSALVIGKTA
jgi:hypothetical protein